MGQFALRPLLATHPHLLPACIETLLICAVRTQASEPVADTMHKLANDVQVLLPLIYQYERPANQTEKALIIKVVGEMLEHVDEISPKTEPKPDTYQISYEALAQQLRQSKQELSRGHEALGLSLLRSVTSVCASCHTQDGRPATWLAPTSDAMDDPLIAGEFLFMTRQYNKAFDAYTAWLQQHEPLKSDNQARSAFGRPLLTALQLQKSPESLNALLAEFASRDDISRSLRKDLTAWITGTNELQASTNIAEHPEPAALQAMATEWLSSGDNEAGLILIPEALRPKIIWLRGELYHALINATNRNMIPDWLYWLAVSDRVLEYRVYYSLADMYLKQCMLEYTDDPIAQSCYSEYENYTLFSYSGSSGTHIPADVKVELESLRNKVLGSKASPPPAQ